MTPEARQRQTRAFVARALLRLQQEEKLEDAVHWTWEQLSRMPRWCLYETDVREQLQRICGLVVLAPSIARWIDGELIRAVHELVGSKLVESLASEASRYAEVDAYVCSCDQRALCVEIPDVLRGTIAVDEYLLHAGAAVLRASLDPSLPLERLADSLSESAIEIDREIANCVLNRAELQLAMTSETDCEESVA